MNHSENQFMPFNLLETLATLAKNSELLIAHNAISELQAGTGRKLHMPSSEIGKIVQQAGIENFLLSHRMNRTLGREKEMQQLISKHYQGSVVFAGDMDVLIPIKR